MTFQTPGGIGQLRPQASAAPGTWDPSNTSSWVVLSNANRTATGTAAIPTYGGFGMTRGICRNSGLRYLEYSFPNFTGSTGCGMALSGVVMRNITDDRIGFQASDVPSVSSLGIYRNAYVNVYQSGQAIDTGFWTSAAGDIIQIAMNFGNGYGWIGLNNTWLSQPQGLIRNFYFDPGDVFPLALLDNSTMPAPDTLGVVIINTLGPFTYTMPSGFSAWGS